mmetsp:Transcript_8700/g.15666  ORF Transcript_8700/g.15666 Transcript_8700/m.15666 type:complete len:756 (-) Transcript_8700:31-2298(-)
MSALSQEDLSLDETFHMMPTGHGEPSSLDVLREHGHEVAALREALTQISSAAGMARWVEQSSTLEAKLGMHGDPKVKAALLQARWPATEIEQANAFLAASNSMQKSLMSARQQAEATGCGPSIIFDISRLLEAWSQLWKCEVQLKQSSSSLAAVELGVDEYRHAARPICEQLIDKALSLKASMAKSGGDATSKEQAAQYSEQLSKLYFQDWVKEAVRTLGVQVPPIGNLAQHQPGSSPTEPDSIVTFDSMPKPEKETPSPQLLDSRTPPASPSAASRAPAANTATFQTQQPFQAPPAHATAAAAPPPELWQAVHVGDLAAITAFVQRGTCDGRLKDASGHSVLWHAIAFSHFGIATMMMDTFPPGTPTGCDVVEVHARRGDTLLHLLLAARPFGAEAATLFKRISSSIPESFFAKANAAGHNFLHVAASTLNFWVLKYVCLTYPGPIKALLGSEPRQPLRYVSDALPNLVPPGTPVQVPVPEHIALQKLLTKNSAGRIPFADVAIDVGPQDAPTGDASKGRMRFLAHRVVLAAQSPVLLEELDKLPLEPLAKEGINAVIFRVDPRISVEVWRMVLQFLYTGEVHCPFASEPQRMVELLRACALYKLPNSLLDFAQTMLFQQLPNCPPMVALQVFSITTGGGSKDVDCRATREASTYFLLRNAAQVFQDMEPVEVSKILERIFQTVEEMVFNPVQPPANSGQNAASQAHAAYADMQHQQQAQQLQHRQQQYAHQQVHADMYAPADSGMAYPPQFWR